MSRVVRQASILELIEREGGASVATLAEHYGVSPITIHRDLERLAASGLVLRVRGGAQALSRTRPIADTDFARRQREGQRSKQAIATCASAWVEDGSTIFVDASTTALELARFLEANPPNGLTLVTNSPAIAYELSCSNIHLIVTPGEIDQNLRLIRGRWTEEFLRELNFSVAFFSGFGLTLERGLTTAQRRIADTLRVVRQTSERNVALVDASKFGRSALLSIARAQDLDAVIVDESLDESLRSVYLGAGVNLIVAPTASVGPLLDGAGLPR